MPLCCTYKCQSRGRLSSGNYRTVSVNNDIVRHMSVGKCAYISIRLAVYLGGFGRRTHIYTFSASASVA